MIAATVEVHPHRRGRGSDVQYHATVHLIRARALSAARGGDTKNPLTAEERMSHPLGDDISVMRSQNNDMAGGRTGEIHDHDHRSRMTGLIEAETITTARAATIAAVVTEGRDEHRPGSPPERLPKRRPENEA